MMLFLVLGPALFLATATATTTEKIYVLGTNRNDLHISTSSGGAVPVATAIFTDDLHTTGWSKLDIKTSSGSGRGFTDELQAFAAGLAEGWLTASHIVTTQANLWPHVFGSVLDNSTESGVSSKVTDWLDEQEAWSRQQVQAHKATSPFWRQVGFIL